MPSNELVTGTMLIGALALWYLLPRSYQTPPALPSLRKNPSKVYPPDFYPNGHDLELPMGTMRYWLLGNPNHPRVLLIHGLTTGSICYMQMADALVEKGYQVLIYDLWGRGYSDAPLGVNYNEALFTSQAALLLQKVGWTTPIKVIGVSLGGAIATSLTALYPELVEKLVLIAPAGLMDDNDVPRAAHLLRIPLINAIILHPRTRSVLIGIFIRLVQASGKIREGNTAVANIAQVIFDQFSKHEGFFQAWLRTIVEYPFGNLHKRYSALSLDKNRPILVLWGDKDDTVPFRHASTLAKLVPHADIRRYENGGHDILVVESEKIHSDVLEFL